MKPFDLEKAKAGAPLCTREGFRARIVCFDADNDRFPIVALLKSDNGKEYPASFTKEGRFSDGEVDSSNDLLMVGEKKEGWINIYESWAGKYIGAVYNSKEEAMSMRADGQGKIIEMKKKTDYLEVILSSRGTVTTTQIAQDYGMSAKAFNKVLSDLKIQHKVNGQWILYAPYVSKGYVHSKTVNITHKDGRPDTVLNTEWTQRGRIFLYEKLKVADILPLIERSVMDSAS